MYLKEWQNKHLNKIYVYSLLVSDEHVPLWNEQAITRTGSQNNLYLHVRNKEELDDIEQEFDSKFESKAKSILKKAITNQRIDKSDWDILIDYVAAQAVRTPAFYHQTKQFMERTTPDILEDCLDKLVNLKSQPENSSTSKDYYNLLPVFLKSIPLPEDPEHISLEAQTIIGKSSWLFAIKHALSNNSPFREKLKSFHWSIADATDEIEWPTCDNPFIFATKYPNGTFRLERLLVTQAGLNQKDKILVFPISPQKILIAKTDGRYPARFKLEKEQSELIRELIIKNAFLYIYHKQCDEIIPQIRPRAVDKEEYKRLHREYNNWYESYLTQEGIYFN